ncbi:hypothetical protein KBC79_03390 [Candidatus Woesebacteria bacterium]|nr:hypothetical protein [Candidatus Woesebacteria bacterium]
MQDASVVPSSTLPQTVSQPQTAPVFPAHQNGASQGSQGLPGRLRSAFGSGNSNQNSGTPGVTTTSVQPVVQQPFSQIAADPQPVAVQQPVATQLATPQQVPAFDTVPDSDKLGVLSAVIDQLEAERPNVSQHPVPVASDLPQPVMSVQQTAQPVITGAQTPQTQVDPSQPSAVGALTDFAVQQQAQQQMPQQVQSQVQPVDQTDDQANNQTSDQTDDQANDSTAAFAQAVPAVIDTVTTPTPQAQPKGPTAKEHLATASIDQSIVDAGGGVQYVEQEPVPEIPVEVESFIQRVENHQQTAPQEIVIADGTQGNAQTHYPSKPVVVLPITEEIEKEGESKSPRFSVRWLVEWSHKIIKMFAGKVIYRQVKS